MGYKRRFGSAFGYANAARNLYNVGRAAYSSFSPGKRLRLRRDSGYGGSRTRTRQRRKTRSGAGVTHEHDVRQVYRKTRMPMRKRRAWRSFTRKVDAVSEKNRGTLSVAYNSSFRNTQVAGLQAMYGIVLYGYQGSVVSGLGYYSDMVRLAAITKPGDTPSVRVVNRKIHFRSAVLDLTVHNNATDTCECDVYEHWYKKDVPWVSLDTMLTAVITDPDTAVLGTGVSPNQVGVTPFQIGSALKYVTISKKTKIFILGTNGFVAGTSVNTIQAVRTSTTVITVTTAAINGLNGGGAADIAVADALLTETAIRICIFP